MTLQEIKQDWIEKRERYLDRANGYKTGHKGAMTRAFNKMRTAFYDQGICDPADRQAFIDFRQY